MEEEENGEEDERVGNEVEEDEPPDIGFMQLEEEEDEPPDIRFITSSPMRPSLKRSSRKRSIKDKDQRIRIYTNKLNKDPTSYSTFRSDVVILVRRGL